MELEQRDWLILGGGAGGLTMASGMSQLGLKVTLVEKANKLGGDCLHSGCVPSKTFIHSAKVQSLMNKADQFGLAASAQPVDLGKVNDHVQQVIDTIQHHDDPERFRGYGVDVIFDQAQFLDSHTVQIGQRKIRAKKIAIATGSSPMIPPIPGLDSVQFLTNETIFSLRKLPMNLIILGAGAIGLELAQAFVRLGSKVRVFERSERLLGMADQECVAKMQETMQKEGVQFHFKQQIHHVEQSQQTIAVHVQNENGEANVFEGDALLVATGRAPNVSGFGLENTGVEFSRRGIVVDNRLRTTQKHIYGVGDVVDSPYKFTHMAEYHAGIVISNGVFRWPKKVSHRVIPSVIYVDPELASVGINEQQAQEQGLSFEVLRFSLTDVDRAIIENSTQGLVKCVVSKRRLLGATIYGTHAGELLAEMALIMQQNAKIDDISATIHAYPTYSQLNRRVVNTHFAKTLFSPFVKKLVKFLN